MSDKRTLFPAIATQSDWVYLDSAATSQMPQCVIDKVHTLYMQGMANVHRSSHQRAARITDEYENARNSVQALIQASSAEEIVWTSGATQAINQIAFGLPIEWQEGDEILISEAEHHANLVPWQVLAKQYDLNLRFIPVMKNGKLNTSIGLGMINERTRLVSMGHVSNATGAIHPIETFIEAAKKVQAVTVIDGSQAIAHLDVNVCSFDCDFYVFSGHKMYGPTGIGVLYGKHALLNQLKPINYGGEIVQSVALEGAEFVDTPQKLEAGTSNISGIIGLGEAARFLQKHKSGMQVIENELFISLCQQIKALPTIQILCLQQEQIPVLSFIHKTLSNHDVGILLSEQGIAVRAGHHCAMPLMNQLNEQGSVRVSIAGYNNQSDINRLITALKNIDRASFKEPTGSSFSKELPVAQSIKASRGWDEIYRTIMLAGRDLTRLPESEKSQHNEVFGCESQVWVTCHWSENQLTVQADASSKIIRGLLSILLEPLQGRDKTFVNQFSATEYLGELGLERHLSSSRGNGLASVLNEIKRSIQ